MSQINGSEKSSRSKADYFELLIADRLAKYYRLDRNFQKELEELKKEVLSFRNGEYRIEEQEQKAKDTVIKLIDFLNKEGVNRLKEIEWIGRQHQTTHTLSDIDITIENDKMIGISLKSVRSGTGTQKNLGFESIKEFLSIDIEADLEEMWQNVRQALLKNGLKQIAELPRVQLKDMKYKFPIIKSIGKTFGLPVQKKAIEESVKNFNSLSAKRKSGFLKCIYGIEDDKKLLNVRAGVGRIQIYWNDKYNAIVEGKNLLAKKITDRSYYIEYKGTPVLRVQASFTNGIGISAFCQRAFLIELNEA